MTSPTDTTPARPVRSAVSAVVRQVRSAPLTSAMTVIIWVLALSARGVPGDTPAAVLGAVATGPDVLLSGRWWTALSAVLWCVDLPGYVVTTVLLIAVLAPVERACGSTLRLVVLMMATQVAGALSTAAIVLLAASAGDEWAKALAGAGTAGAGPMVIGVGVAFTTRLAALWRRRLRLVALLVVVILAAYSGTLHDVLRMCAAFAGLVLGPRLLPRSPRSGELTTSWRERRVLIALIVAGTAIGPVVAALSDTPIGPLSVLRFLFLSPPPDAATVQQLCAVPTNLDDCRSLRAQLRLGGVGPAVMSAMPVVLLLTAADGLRRGRRSAWLVAVLLNVALAGMAVLLATELFSAAGAQLVVFGGLRGSQTLLAILLPLTVPLVLAVLLWRTKDTFDVSTPAATARRLILVVVATLAGLGAVYVVGGSLVKDQFDQAPTVAQLLLDLPTRFVPPGYLGEVNPRFLPVGPVATVLYEWTGVEFWAVLAVALLISFRRHAPGAAATDRDRAAEILVAHGGTALSYLTVWAGNSYHFVPDGTAYVAYRVVGGVAVSVTGPVGAPGARRQAVLEFAASCSARGLTPCLYSVPTDVRDVVAADLGWRSVQVAEETMLPLRALAFTGKRWQDVRTALNKATKTGITGQWWAYSAAPASVTAQVRAISEQWVADKGLPEMGFTLGGLDELADGSVRCLIAVDAQHTVHGITSFLPVHRAGAVVGWTLDFMRRRPGGFPGVMEFLIASAALQFQQEGAEFLSLSGAPLARIDRSESRDPVQRLLDTLGRALEPVYGFRSLLQFKAKFQPVYAPLWLAYPDAAALPAIAGAITRCYLPHLSTRQGGRLLRRLTGRTRSPGDRPEPSPATTVGTPDAGRPVTKWPAAVFRRFSGRPAYRHRHDNV